MLSTQKIGMFWGLFLSDKLTKNRRMMKFCFTWSLTFQPLILLSNIL